MKKATVRYGLHDYEVELRRDPHQLAAELNISLEVAVKLAVMEVLSDNRFGKNESTFKNWKNRRIYFTNLVDSNNSNGKPRYWDLEKNRLVDHGLSYMYQDFMKEALDGITPEMFL